MKVIYFILLKFLLLATCSYSQSLWVENNSPYELLTKIHSIKFENETTGYIGGFHGVTAYIFKTTNAGISWGTEPVWEFEVTGSTNNSMDFDFNYDGNGNKIFYVGVDKFLKKFYQGNTVDILTLPVRNEKHLVKVTGNNTIFYAYSEKMGTTQLGPHYALSLYKSTNTGANWSTPAYRIYNQPTTQVIVLNDIEFSVSNPDNVVVVGHVDSYNESYARYLYSVSTNNFNTFTSSDGRTNSNESDSFDHAGFLANGEVRILGTSGIHRHDYITNSPELIYNTNITNSGFVREYGMSFIDNNNGYIALSNGKIMKTTNSGYNWSQEGTISSAQPYYQPPGMISYGDVSYFQEEIGLRRIFSRKVNANLSIKYDYITPGTGTFYSHGSSFSVPGYSGLRGGAAVVATDNQINGNIFYKWNNNSMDHSGSVIYTPSHGSNVEANFKTKKYSNSPSSISNVTHRRALRDKFGVLNTIHESMGGIFYSRSTDNGNTFSLEEVVNDNPESSNSFATQNNINSSIAELIRMDFTYPPVNSEQTPIISWERRESNEINVNIAERKPNLLNEYYWEIDPDASFKITNVTDPNFQAQPKVVPMLRMVESGIYKNFYAITYLKPNVSGNKLMVRCIDETNIPPIVKEFEIASGNITDVSIEGVFSKTLQPYYLYLHMSYKKDYKIYYRKEEIYYCAIGGLSDICRTTDPNPFEVSSADGLGSRYTPDISLSNGNPVIAYRGSKTISRTIVWDNPGPSEPIIDEMNIAKNPIYIRKKNSSGQWGNFEIYNSNGSEAQLNPDVEGSKDADAHLIGFSVGNPSTGATFKKFVKIAGQSGYNCDPGIFNGNDAMFVKGSYTGTTGSTSYPMLWTSKSENSLYKIDKQSFVISNMISTPDSYNNLAGVVGMEGLDYTFTLGPIFAASTIPALDPKDAPTHISSFVEFNENMVSAPFVMSDLDTLILGAAGSYTPSSESAFSNTIRYDVNLLYASTGNLHRVLFTDTVHAGDSLEPEFLRGFIIENIPNGSDSFYIQLALYEDDLNGGDYTLNGVYMGSNSEGGDNPGFKTMVFFEGDNNVNGNQAFIPKEYALQQNYPNPFNPSTTISYDIPKDGLVKMKIYDLAGREVRTIVNELKSAGRYTVSFNGSNLSSGVYFYRIEVGDFIQTKRMMLVK